MSAPSQLHEDRVAVLGDLATLAGYTAQASIDGRLRPDLVRLDPRRHALLLADAKATESPADVATRGQLLRYAQVAQLWAVADFDVDLGVAHGPEERRAWATCLLEVGRRASFSDVRPWAVEIDDATWVTVVALRR